MDEEGQFWVSVGHRVYTNHSTFRRPEMRLKSKFVTASGLAILAHLLCAGAVIAATAGRPGVDELTIAAGGQTSAQPLVSDDRAWR